MKDIKSAALRRRRRADRRHDHRARRRQRIEEFNIRDGAAHRLGAAAGLPIGLLSARTADATACARRSSGSDRVAGRRRQARRLRADPRDGRTRQTSRSATWATTCWTCRCLRRAGFSAAPADAAPEVRAAAHWISASGGGRGAVRECIEHVLRAQGHWARGRRRVSRLPDGTVHRATHRAASPCWPASRSARRGSATSCRTAAGSTAAARANRRTTCSASTSWSPTRSTRRSTS